MRHRRAVVRRPALVAVTAPLWATALVLTATTSAAAAPSAPAARAAAPAALTAPVGHQVAVAASGDAYSLPLTPDRTTGALGTLMAGDEALDGRTSYLRFPLPLLPVDASNVTATLVLHQLEPSRAGTVKVWSVANGWDQATLSARNAPGLDALLGRTTAAVGGAATTFAVPPSRLVVRGSVAFGVTAFLASSTALAFASTENADPAMRPQLLISYVTGAGCPLSALLVPACGALLGSTANQLGTETTATQAVTRQEAELGRALRVVHVYHSAGEDWPTTEEVALASDAVHPRLLLENWKPENGRSWAQVASGSSDALIDVAAARIVARLGGRPFFFTVHHEPEEEVKAAGSGFAPADYAAMYRHVVLRLRADGVSGLVAVWDVMGYSTYADRGFYASLYPGDDVVDWIGYDPYSSGGSPLTTFANNAGKVSAGFYDWAVSAHPGKPLMLGEWGVAGSTSAMRAGVLTSLVAAARTLPALKAYVYFDHGPDATTHGINYAYDTDPTVLAAARAAFVDAYLQP